MIDFNKRKPSALTSVYNLFHNEFVFFTEKLLEGLDIEPSDLFHDVLIKVWTNSTIIFNTVNGMKAYLYTSIRNSAYNLYEHKRCVDNYARRFKENPNEYLYEVSNSELLSEIYTASKFLPQELAQIFKMLLDGYDIVEIAEKLNKSQSYIYNKRREGILLLTEKFKNNKSYILLIMCGL